MEVIMQKYWLLIGQNVVLVSFKNDFTIANRYTKNACRLWPV
jgi:hypothetical protein